MNSGLRVLWVKSGGFLPLDTGGKIRSYNLMRELGRRHEVDVFTFYPRQPEDLHSQLAKEFPHAFCIPMRLPERASLTDVLAYGRNLLSKVPYPMAKYCRKEIATELRSLLKKQKYDALVCDFLLTAAVIPWDLKIPTVIFTHNVEAVIWRRHYEVSRNPVFRAVSWREYKTMDHVERMYLNKADHVLAVSDNDRDIFSEYLPLEKMTVIPTGVDTEYFQPQPGREVANRLVFTGSMDWMPNDDAIHWFAESILPLIERTIPDVQLFVVGRKPSQKLMDLGAQSRGRIVVTGTVDDIRPYIAKGSVYVVPLRVGGGTRIKIFEALGMGKAVVSTSIGAEGLPIQSGKHFIAADSPEDFAARTVALLKDAAARERLGSEARRIVAENYSWNAVSKVFDDVFSKIVTGSSTAQMQRASG